MNVRELATVVGIVMFACLMAALVAVVLSSDGKRPAPNVESREPAIGCACAGTSAHATKFLIFWSEKQKEGDKELKVFKISDKLFDHLEEACKTVPPSATEVRIVTVKID